MERGEERFQAAIVAYLTRLRLDGDDLGYRYISSLCQKGTHWTNRADDGLRSVLGAIRARHVLSACRSISRFQRLVRRQYTRHRVANETIDFERDAQTSLLSRTRKHRLIYELSTKAAVNPASASLIQRVWRGHRDRTFVQQSMNAASRFLNDFSKQVLALDSHSSRRLPKPVIVEIDGVRRVVMRFLVDSGANVHCVRNPVGLGQLIPSYGKLHSVSGLEDTKQFNAAAVILDGPDKATAHSASVPLGAVHVTPNSPADILSVSRLVNEGFEFHFTPTAATTVAPDGQVYPLERDPDSEMWYLELAVKGDTTDDPHSERLFHRQAAIASKVSARRWQERLGFLHEVKFRDLVHTDAVRGMKIDGSSRPYKMSNDSVYRKTRSKKSGIPHSPTQEKSWQRPFSQVYTDLVVDPQ